MIKIIVDTTKEKKLIFGNKVPTGYKNPCPMYKITNSKIKLGNILNLKGLIASICYTIVDT